MRIAVPSDDGITIAEHFGRSTCFVIYEIDGGSITGRQVIPNSFSKHSHSGSGGHGPGESGCDHGALIACLDGCEAVICRGLGRKIAADLAAVNIKPVVISDEATADTAAQHYASGTLKTLQGADPCRHHGRECHE